MARALLLLAALPTASLAGVVQKPLIQDALNSPSPSSDHTQPPRKLHGRFLHITDIHPDPFYKIYASTAEGIACHRSTGPAGYYGAETSDCDSPFSLVNATFTWIAQNLASNIDFVIWTGDSARHDNDEHHPRSTSSVVSLNRFLVQKFEEVFGVDEKVPGGSGRGYKIPIVPSFGNNDILPHNLFFKGPNRWTKTYGDIWRAFIPEQQRHSFERGGWFYVEVIPNKLAVFSLNTMYFFDANTAVDGCARHTEPGYEHMEWLRIQLQFLRERGVKAIMSGHVPPARNEEKAGWDETCWQKYALWMRQYRDVVVGSVFGHMNIEHFVLQDFADIDFKEMEVQEWDEDGDRENENRDVIGEEDEDDGDDGDGDGEIEVQVKAPDYLTALRDLWARLPVAPKDELSAASRTNNDLSISKKRKSRRTALQKYHDKIGGEYAERFAVSHISASVVPNFFSTLRVYEYNIAGLGDSSVPAAAAASSQSIPPWPERVDREVQGRPDPGRAAPAFLPSMEILCNPITHLLTRLNLFLARLIPTSLHASLPTHVTTTDHQLSTTTHKKHHHRKHKHRRHKHRSKKPNFTVPDPPAKDAPPGPAYSLQPLSWTGYVQYVANNTYLNNDFTGSSSSSSGEDDKKGGQVAAQAWNPGRYTDRTPSNRTEHGRPKPSPRPFEFYIEYDTRDFKDKYALGEGLTVRKWVELAARIGEFRGQGDSVEVSKTECEEAEGKSDGDSQDEDDSDDAENESDDASEAEHELQGKKKKNHHGKKKKHDKHRKRKIINRDWYAFVLRAVTGTLSDEELHDQFGEVDALPFDQDDGLVCDVEGSDCHLRPSDSDEEDIAYPIRAQADGSKITFDAHEREKIMIHQAEARAYRNGVPPRESMELGY